MLNQVRLQDVFSRFPLLHADLLPLIATLLTLIDRDYETIWDLSNRVCDRYLPELTAG